MRTLLRASAFIGVLHGVSACGSTSADAGKGTGTGGAGASAGSAGHAGNTSALGGSTNSGGGATGEAGATADAAGATACASADAPLTNTDDPTTMPTADPAHAADVHHFFTITVKDAATSAPIPGVELKTVNEIVSVSDENGVVAFYEPGLMGLSVFFSASHPGYEYPADGFGLHGKALTVTEGGSADLLLNRLSGTAAAPQGDLQSRLAAGPVPGAKQCTAIRVFEGQNHRGVPLVRLSAFGEDYWSDSQGMIAHCNPDHAKENVSFAFFTHGYALASSGTSITIATSPGGAASVELTRSNIAERLYRLIGGGVYRDSLILGLKAPLTLPVLNAQVLGSDTASTTVYQGNVFWLWQDTNRVAYALGNFHGTAATSKLPASGGLSANLGVDFSYFTGTDGFAAPMCNGCEGGPAWMGGLASVPDSGGVERLFAGYVVVDSNGAALESGLARFNDAAQHFDRVLTDFATRQDFGRPDGHDYHFRHGDQTYVYYSSRLRIPGTAEAFLDPDHYEQFSPYAAGGATALLKNPDGSLSYSWRAGARHVTSAALKTAGIGADQDFDGHEVDADTGTGVATAGPSVAWNAHRRRFVEIFQQNGGSSSFLGEIWHAEADTPLGPFVYARKIITHDDYTFYNTLHHPELDRGQFMYVEGTYTASYSGAKTLTPRYNYNQILYRVDLEDPKLDLPVAVYDLGGTLPGNFGTKAEARRDTPSMAAAFLAPDRPGASLVGVAWSGPACDATRQLVASATPPTAPLFYALPASTPKPPPHTLPLYEYRDTTGRYAYGLAGAVVPAGFTRAVTPLAFVWENPVSAKVPVSEYLGDLVANAGADQCATAQSGSAEVQLSAAGSASTSGKIRKVLWHTPGAMGCEYAEGDPVTVRFPPGVYSVEVEVTDDQGNVARDTRLVRVN